ncbi:hypothetical protein K435DRAFT_756426 [Dendrothele bispora CBS 962.96]|uniref:SWI/SNF and RSC complexes subunit Ssr4 N-terminal domain-containing protein n=1 Tax=Dendrothele bispora (strain CBS 962.96) TaxID=1314807 RepID=A0A4S8LYE4_DENBC|nr:hypothetical protein K435DRAFT_756426 [Dendrothele bispora CBS 962.96]
MSTPLLQAQAEGLCLRFPNDLPPHPQISLETAVNMLARATNMAQQTPFSWGWIDRPQEGAVHIVFLTQPNHFPNDGIRWQEQENKYTMTVGPNRELEVSEIKFGFIPGSGDMIAWRARRRYRFIKNGHPSLFLVHYYKGPQAPVVPALMNQPVRMYPLRQFMEPSVYVMGERTGQKVFPNGPPQPGGAPSGMGMMPGMPMGLAQQQAMLAQQNSNMEMLEQRRRENERQAQQARTRAGTGNVRPRPEDDDSGDEAEGISTRALAMTRYKRNHDLMNEVFVHAAYGDRNKQPPPSPYSIFSKTELEEKTAKLQAELEALQNRAAERQREKDNVISHDDVSMAVDGIKT